MRCTSCGFENSDGMKFCGEGATPLKHHCPQCGFTNPSGFKFCGECATPLPGRTSIPKSQLPPVNPAPVTYTPPHLAGRIRAEQRALEARGRTDGERKTITALFADIKDSTALVEDLDPEAARRLRPSLATTRQTCRSPSAVSRDLPLVHRRT